MANVRVKIKLDDVRRMYGRLKGQLRDRAGLLAAVAEWMRFISRQSFERQKTPEGKPWRPLSQPYGRLKERGAPGGRQTFGERPVRPGGPPSGKTAAIGRSRILYRSSALFRSIQSGVQGTVAYVQSFGTLPYSAIHQYGGVIQIPEIRAKPGKALRFFNGNLQAIFATRVRAHAVRIPARPYLPGEALVAKEGARIVNEHLEDAIKGASPSRKRGAK